MENASRTSAMDQIFVGLIKSTITCACEAQSSILDPIGAITLDISSDAITTIIDAFDVYCCGSFAEYDCEESLRKEGLKNDPLPKRCKFNEIDLNDSNSEENCKGSHSQSPSPKRRKFNDIDLNDPNPEENWRGSISKSRSTYYDLQYLKKCRKLGFYRNIKKNSVLLQKENLVRTIKKKAIRTKNKKAFKTKVDKLQNSLTYNPNVYMKRTKNEFVVAFFRKYKVNNSGYRTLLPNVWLSDGLIEFVFKTYEGKSENMGKSIQFDVSRTHLLIDQNTRNLKLPKIEKNILIAGLLRSQHYTLFIIDKVNRTFSYLDPYGNNATVTKKHFTSFKNFILRHNAAYPKCVLPTEAWIIKVYEYSLQKDSVNCGVYIIQYAKQFCESNNISPEDFCISTFREYLQHHILKSSEQMKRRCVICGILHVTSPLEEGEKDKDFMIQCCNKNCSRYTHNICLPEPITAEEAEAQFFVCFICRE